MTKQALQNMTTKEIMEEMRRLFTEKERSQIYEESFLKVVEMLKRSEWYMKYPNKALTDGSFKITVQDYVNNELQKFLVWWFEDDLVDESEDSL